MLSTVYKDLDLHAGGKTQFCFAADFVALQGWTQAPGLQQDLIDMATDDSTSSSSSPPQASLVEFVVVVVVVVNMLTLFAATK